MHKLGDELRRRCSWRPGQYDLTLSPVGHSSEFAAFVRRIRSDVCYYLFVRDERHRGGAVAADVWFAPPDMPDDGLASLGIGSHLRIAEEETVNGTFCMYIAKAVAQQSLDAAQLADEVETMLKSASGGPGLRPYRLLRRAYLAASQLRNLPEGQDWLPVFKCAKDVASGTQRFKILDEMTETVYRHMFARQPKIPDMALYSEDVDIVAWGLSRQFYIEALVPNSARSTRP